MTAGAEFASVRHCTFVTKTEFISRQQTSSRGANRRAIVWLIVFFGVPVIGLVLLRRFKHFEYMVWVIGIGYILFLFGNLVALFWSDRRAHIRYGFNCPSCGSRIEGASAKVAIATDHCGTCGKKVFSEGHTA